jgi:hypothetical protein
MTDRAQLRQGDQVPHVQVRTVEGTAVSYSDIWQRQNLLLIVLSETSAADEFMAALRAHREEFEELQSVYVVTRDRVAGTHPDSALVADRWGEIVHVAPASASGGLPPVEELLEWLRYIQHRCPECEGEAR